MTRQTETEEGIARQVVRWVKTLVLTMLSLRDGGKNKVSQVKMWY